MKNCGKNKSGLVADTGTLREPSSATLVGAILRLADNLQEVAAQLGRAIQDAQGTLGMLTALGDELRAIAQAANLVMGPSAEQVRGAGPNTADRHELNLQMGMLAQLAAISQELCRALDEQRQALRQLLADRTAQGLEREGHTNPCSLPAGHGGIQPSEREMQLSLTLGERYKWARQLAGQGVPEEQIARQCGLAREEVRLLIRQQEAETTGRRGMS